MPEISEDQIRFTNMQTRKLTEALAKAHSDYVVLDTKYTILDENHKALVQYYTNISNALDAKTRDYEALIAANPGCKIPGAQ